MGGGAPNRVLTHERRLLRVNLASLVGGLAVIVLLLLAPRYAWLPAAVGGTGLLFNVMFEGLAVELDHLHLRLAPPRPLRSLVWAGAVPAARITAMVEVLVADGWHAPRSRSGQGGHHRQRRGRQDGGRHEQHRRRRRAEHGERDRQGDPAEGRWRWSREGVGSGDQYNGTRDQRDAGHPPRCSPSPPARPC